MTIQTILTLFGGAQAILLGLIGYFGKLWLSRFEIRLEASLERAVHASQAQFDREFQFYQDVWRKLSKIRSGIRRTVQPGTPAEGSHDQENGAEAAPNGSAIALANLVEELRELIEFNRPFFPPEFAKDLKEIYKLADEWSNEVTSGRSERKGWFLGEGTTLLKKMDNCYDVLDKRIRRRLENIANAKGASRS